MIRPVDNDDLIAAYWRFQSLAKSKSREDRLASDKLIWAHDTVCDAMSRGGDEAVKLLVDLAEAAPDDHAVGMVGTGPIEDLLAEHGAAVVDALDLSARTHARLRLALRSVYWGDLPTVVVERLRRYEAPPTN